MNPCGVLLRIFSSATDLVPVFAIVTRGASVPYQDVIATRVAHVPVVVLFFVCLVLTFPLSVRGRVGLRPHKVVVPLLVAHSHVIPALHLGFCLLVRVFQGSGAPLPVHMPREVPFGKWLLRL